jgi:two-component system copper resistance phosphate regulon response regulator CusR
MLELQSRVHPFRSSQNVVQQKYEERLPSKLIASFCWDVSHFFSHLPYDAGMRLLLVEDDARIARFVAKGLREQAYAVDVAATGDDALYQAAINTYDLVILDVMIPGRDGFEVCRELRKSGQRMPILMLTARDAVEDRITGLDHGADDYLTKPFEFRELLARLRALLRRSGELRPAKIIVADLVLDTAAQSTFRGGRPILLTAKEYALLEFLARNAGRVIGRAEIAEHVWDETFDPFSNLIEVYINRLRRKIDEQSAKPLLHTRRGAGYVLGSLGEPATADLIEEATAARRGKGSSSPRKGHG